MILYSMFRMLFRVQNVTVYHRLWCHVMLLASKEGYFRAIVSGLSLNAGTTRRPNVDTCIGYYHDYKIMNFPFYDCSMLGSCYGGIVFV